MLSPGLDLVKSVILAHVLYWFSPGLGPPLVHGIIHIFKTFFCGFGLKTQTKSRDSDSLIVIG